MGADGKTAAPTKCDSNTKPVATSVCAAITTGMSCDDGDDQTMRDSCQGTVCAGKVALVSQLRFDIAIDDVSDLPAEDSESYKSMETDIKAALAATLTSASLECTVEDITIISISAGSLLIDYKVEVAAEAVSPETRSSAVAAVASPSSPLAAIVITDSSGQSLTTGAAVGEEFISYAYTRVPGACPTEPACGTAALVVEDSYLCQENFGTGLIPTGDSVCIAPLGPKPTSQTTCPDPLPCPTCSDWTQNGDETGVDCGGSCRFCLVYVDDVDCAGSWSRCTVACENATQRTWTQVTAQSGAGRGCPSAVPCRPGDDNCPAEAARVVVQASGGGVSTEVIVALVLVIGVFCLTLVAGYAWLRKLRNTLKVIPERYAAEMDAALAEKDLEMLELRREQQRIIEEQEQKLKERKKRGRVVVSDGVVSDLAEQETRRLRQLFYEFDEDGSGALDRHEVAALTERLGDRFTEEELDEAMLEMDEDGSGTSHWTLVPWTAISSCQPNESLWRTGGVDFEEFYEWYAAARTGNQYTSSAESVLPFCHAS